MTEIKNVVCPICGCLCDGAAHSSIQGALALGRLHPVAQRQQSLRGAFHVGHALTAAVTCFVFRLPDVCQHAQFFCDITAGVDGNHRDTRFYR